MYLLQEIACRLGPTLLEIAEPVRSRVPNLRIRRSCGGSRKSD